MSVPQVLKDLIRHKPPFQLEACTTGKFSVVQQHVKAGTEMNVLSMRNALFLGMSPMSVTLPEDTQYHYLIKGRRKRSFMDGEHPGAVMTSDIPQEMFTQQLAFRHADREKLITVMTAGLGIGMAAVMIANYVNVKRVVVVEKEQDVIDMVKPQLPKTKASLEIVHADVYDYIKRGRKNKFDFIYLDTWSGTGENVWQDELVPLRRLIAKHYGWKTEVRCWLEDEMRGQLRLGFNNMLHPIPGTEVHLEAYINRWRPRWVFWNAVQQNGIEKDERRIQQLMNFFFMAIGSPAWEDQFRWDAYRKPAKEKKT